MKWFDSKHRSTHPMASQESDSLARSESISLPCSPFWYPYLHLYAVSPMPIPMLFVHWFYCFFVLMFDICLILFDCVVSNFKSATKNKNNQASLNLHTSLLCQFVQVLAGCFRALQDTLKTMSGYDNLGVPKDPIQMVPTKALQTWEDMTWESLKTDMVDKMCEMSFKKWTKNMCKKYWKSIKMY